MNGDLGGILVAAGGVLVIAGLVAVFLRLSRNGDPTVGHHDPDAIGTYEFDPAVPHWRYRLPGVQRGRPLPPGSGPPGRRPTKPPPD